MRIDRGRGNVRMPKQDLYNPGIDAVLQQPRGVGVAQTVGCDGQLDPSLGTRTAEGLPQANPGDRSGAITSGKQPTRITVYQPQRPQVVEKRLR
jgi:hypothetical protein